MSVKKTFREWLEDFKKKVVIGYNNTTMATALAEHVYKDSDKIPATLLKYDGPLRASASASESIVTIKAGLRSVKPQDAGFTCDLKDWSDNPEGHYMGMLMDQLGKHLADNEYAIIVDAMKNYAGDTVKTKQNGQLSKDDIMEAQNHAEGYADCVVMNHQQKNALWLSGQIFEPFNISLSFVPKERRGYYYSGMLGAVNVYWAGFIKDFALVFDRRKMLFVNTPTEIRFDNESSPRQLIVRKMCVAAPMFDQAVVKIELV